MGVRILFIPCCTVRAAATRLRVYQYIPHLEEAGFTCRVFPAISETSTDMMFESPTYSTPQKIGYYAWICLERLVRFIPILILAVQSDVLFLQRSTFPFGLERLLRWANENIIFDFDDAIYMADLSESHQGFLWRIKDRTKASEVSGMLKVSKRAVAEHRYLAEYAEKYCADVTIIPGPLDTRRSFVREIPNTGPVTIGWIGSPSTTAYLRIAAPALAELSRVHDIRVKLIGAGDYKIEGVRSVNVPWAEDTEVEELQSFDIGIMPQPDDEWSRGKLGCKMLQYMAVGVPTVLSYTPTNAAVIEDGVNGFVVHSEPEWIEKLTRLIEDPGLRKKIGSAGRRTVHEGYSLEAAVPKLLGLVHGLLKESRAAHV